MLRSNGNKSVLRVKTPMNVSIGAPRNFVLLILTNLIIGLCILLRVYQLNTGRTSKVFLVLDFIVHFSQYMFRPRLAAIFRWFVNTKNIFKAVTIYSTDPCCSVRSAQ
jgi:membrane-anchored protein YejM (alkaline phosphatase superfamily)